MTCYVVQAKGYANFARDTLKEAERSETLLRECGYKTRIVCVSVPREGLPIWRDV